MMELRPRLRAMWTVVVLALLNVTKESTASRLLIALMVSLVKITYVCLQVQYNLRVFM